MKPVTTSRPPILLIEDTISLQMVYRSILTASGYRVVTASSAAEGIEQFRLVRPQLVLLDLILPDRDGVDLMRDMLAYLPETEVIAITANGSVNRAVEAMRAGARDFLVKPFDESRLIGAIQALTSERRGRTTGTSTSPEVFDGSGFIGSSSRCSR
jgi:two-component system repressor protein LuxO